jgi:hypothetical protein
LATLCANGTTVSLEFRFDDREQVAAVHTPARWGRFGGGFRQVGWEGHFGGYARHQGVLVPAEGEVGWYPDGAAGPWRCVWRARVEPVEFRFR